MREGDWVWCINCKQCYQLGWNTRGQRTTASPLCPYWNCDGCMLALEWRRALILRPDLPKQPMTNQVYKVDGWLWCGRCQRCFRYSDLYGECSYRDCVSHSLKRAYPWWVIWRKHKGYPKVPVRNQRYSHMVVRSSDRRRPISSRLKPSQSKSARPQPSAKKRLPLLVSPVVPILQKQFPRPGEDIRYSLGYDPSKLTSLLRKSPPCRRVSNKTVKVTCYACGTVNAGNSRCTACGTFLGGTGVSGSEWDEFERGD